MVAAAAEAIYFYVAAEEEDKLSSRLDCCLAALSAFPVPPLSSQGGLMRSLDPFPDEILR